MLKVILSMAKKVVNVFTLLYKVVSGKEIKIKTNEKEINIINGTFEVKERKDNEDIFFSISIDGKVLIRIYGRSITEKMVFSKKKEKNLAI